MRFKSNSKKRVGGRRRTRPQGSVRPSVCTPRAGWGNSRQAALPIFQQDYGDRSEPLPVVAITDGARTIRRQLAELFGQPVPVILDWYHLDKKVGELMSMVARNKQEKAVHVAHLLHHLWHGRTDAALTYLRREVEAKNPEQLAALVTYLEKHQAEIIDYGRRQRAGKPIGSGRMEKGVDQVIGARQKHKGMSWSPTGSKALGILKVVELNQQWEQLWFPQQVAALLQIITDNFTGRV